MHRYNAFTIVQQGGDNFLYTETELKSGWKSALYSNLGAGGGIAAAGLGRFKGVVWDFKNQEFNIFRNCKDLNVFLTEHYPKGVSECKTKEYDLLLVREIIGKIK